MTATCRTWYRCAGIAAPNIPIAVTAAARNPVALNSATASCTAFVTSSGRPLMPGKRPFAPLCAR